MLLELGPPCGGAWTTMHMARSSMSMVSMEVALRPCLLPVPARPLASCSTIPRPAMVVFFQALVPVLLPYEPTASMLPVVRGRAPETQVGLSRSSVTIQLCDSYCLGLGLEELVARRLSSCAVTAGGVCCIRYCRFRLTSVDTPFRGGSARSVSIRRL